MLNKSIQKQSHFQNDNLKSEISNEKAPYFRRIFLGLIFSISLMLSEVSVEVQTQTLPTVEVVVNHSGPTAIHQPNNPKVAEVGHSIDNQDSWHPSHVFIVY